jgi:hypothetical protein
MTSADDLFAKAVAKVFDQTLGQTAVEHMTCAGSLRLRMMFASESLAQAYLPSFLQDGSGPVDLTIGVVGAQVDLSELIASPADESRTYVSAAYFSVWYADRLPMLYVLERKTRRGFVWLSTGTAPKWELSRPVCPLIHAVSVETPWVAIHGGAVGRDGRSLMLAGKGHSGKTTAALACARAGWDYAGDDYVFAHTRTGQIEPLYASARLRIDMAEPFADMLSASTGISEDDGEMRHELRLSRYLKPERIKGGRVRAILLPRRRGARHPEFSPARRADAFSALFVTTTLGMPGPLHWVADKVKVLVGCAPAFFVDTGQTPEAIPDAFARFLSRIS